MSWTGWVYLGTCAPWAACLVLYGLRSPWRTSRVGVAMLVTYASLTVVLGLAAALRVFHPPRGAAVLLALCALTAVALAGVVQLVAIVRAQKRDRSSERDVTGV